MQQPRLAEAAAAAAALGGGGSGGGGSCSRLRLDAPTFWPNCRSFTAFYRAACKCLVASLLFEVLNRTHTAEMSTGHKRRLLLSTSFWTALFSGALESGFFPTPPITAFRF